MKYLYCIFCFLILIVPVNGQNNCQFTGSVLDSLGFPVQDANLTAFNYEDVATTYSFSDAEGYFKLELPCDQDFEVEITHINYKDKVVPITSKRRLNKTIVLEENAISLNQIIAQGRKPITIKGDTIEYNAASFLTGQEEVLEDLLKNLPGLRVEDGKIYYKDKQIQSIKVEGREVFGGSAKILSKNLPADAISKVQLNKKFKSNPFSNSLQSDEQPELNIVLKENKKSLTFGNVVLSGDATKHYNAQSKVFRFSPKIDITVIGDFNTIGKQVFGPEDYYNFLGGSNFLFDSKGHYSLRDLPNNFSFGQANNASKIKNHLIASHIGYVLPKDWEIKAFAVASDEGLGFNSVNKRFFNHYDQTDLSSNENKSSGILGRFELKGYPTKNLIFNYNLLQNYQEQDNFNDLLIIRNFNDESVQQNSKQDLINFGLTQKLRLIQNLKGDNNIGLYFTHNFKKEANQYGLNGQSFLIENATNQLFEDYKFKSNDFQIHSVYNHLLTNTINLEVVGGFNFARQTLNNVWLNNDIDVQNVDEQYDFKQSYMTSTLTKQWEKLKLQAGVEIHHLDFGAKNLKGIKELKVLPNLKLNYKFNSTKFTELIYDVKIGVPNLADLSNSRRIQDYYLLKTGNPDLHEGIYHSLNFSIGNFNMIKFFNYFLSLNYSLLDNNIRNASSFEAGLQRTFPINVISPESSLSLHFQIEKKLRKWYKVKFTNTTSYNEFENIINQNSTDITQLSNSIHLKNNFKIRKKLESDLNFEWTYSLYENKQLNSTFHTFKPNLKTAYIFNNRFIGELYLAHRVSMQNTDVIDKFTDINLKLRYKIMKGVYFYINANNLLNNSEIINTGFTDNYSYTNSRDVLGRYILAEFKLKF